MERFSVIPEETETDSLLDESETKDTKNKRKARQKSGGIGLGGVRVEKEQATAGSEAQKNAEKDYFSKFLADIGLKKEVNPALENAKITKKLKPAPNEVSNEAPAVAPETVGTAQPTEQELYSRERPTDPGRADGELLIDHAVPERPARSAGAGTAPASTEFDPLSRVHETLPLPKSTDSEQLEQRKPETAADAADSTETTAEPLPPEPLEEDETIVAAHGGGGARGGGPTPPPTPAPEGGAAAERDGTMSSAAPVPPYAGFGGATTPPPPGPPAGRQFGAPLSAPRFNYAPAVPLTPAAELLRSSAETTIIKRSAKDFLLGAAVGALIEHGRHGRKEKKLRKKMSAQNTAHQRQVESLQFDTKELLRKQAAAERRQAMAGREVHARAAQAVPEALAVAANGAEQARAGLSTMEQPKILTYEQSRPPFVPSPSERANAVFRSHVVTNERLGLPPLPSETQQKAAHLAEHVRTQVLAEATSEALLKPEQLHLPKGHRIERSAWHNIEVDVRTGRAVENSAIEYGEEYYKERAHEGRIVKDNVGAAATGVALAAVAAARARTRTPEDAKRGYAGAEASLEQLPPDGKRRKKSSAAAGANGSSDKTAAALEAGKQLADKASEVAKKTLDTVTRPPKTASAVRGWVIALLALLLAWLVFALP